MKDRARLEEVFSTMLPCYPPTSTRTLFDIKSADGEVLSLGHTSEGHARMIRDIYWPEAEIVAYEARCYEAEVETIKGQTHIRYRRS